MLLVDSHCHLDSASLTEPVESVIERARSAGVGAFVCVGVGVDARAASESVMLARKHRDLFACVGMHPHDAAFLDEALFRQLTLLAQDERVVAVGEIGLDYHYDHSPRPVQGEVFRKMISLARHVRKPIVIHTREARADTLSILEEENARDVGGIIHCFTEDVEFARRALDLGFDLSFSGILTFKSAEAIRGAAVYAPSHRILVETDSPYLSPVPVRGKRCEPAFVVHTAQALARTRGVPFDRIVEDTSRNARQRFALELPWVSAQD